MELNRVNSEQSNLHFQFSHLGQAAHASPHSSSSLSSSGTEKSCWESFVAYLKKAWDWIGNLFCCNCCKKNLIEVWFENKQKAAEELDKNPKAFITTFIDAFLENTAELLNSMWDKREQVDKILSLYAMIMHELTENRKFDPALFQQFFDKIPDEDVEKMVDELNQHLSKRAKEMDAAIIIIKKFHEN